MSCFLGVLTVKFSSEKRERFLTLLESGRTIGEAAADVGIARQTIFNWRNRGRLGDGEAQVEFAERMDAIGLEDDGLERADLIRMLEKQARNGSTRAIQLLLERPWERKRETETKPPANPFAEIIEIETARQASQN